MASYIVIAPIDLGRGVIRPSDTPVELDEAQAGQVADCVQLVKADGSLEPPEVPAAKPDQGAPTAKVAKGPRVAKTATKVVTKVAAKKSTK